MKSYKNLYPQIYDFGNLYLAFLAARRGKRGQVAVASFEFDLERNLLQLETELREQTYRPGPYTNFYIYEPKRRLVSAAPFRDRVVHHALCQVIEPPLKFPKSQRFLLAERLSKMALDFYDHVLEAVMEPERQEQHLDEADRLLTKLRLYLRLSYDLGCISSGQLEHAARRLDEIGRLIGGWKRKRAKDSRERKAAAA